MGGNSQDRGPNARARGDDFLKEQKREVQIAVVKATIVLVEYKLSTHKK